MSVLSHISMDDMMKLQTDLRECLLDLDVAWRETPADAAQTEEGRRLKEKLDDCWRAVEELEALDREVLDDLAVTSKEEADRIIGHATAICRGGEALGEVTTPPSRVH